MPYIALLRNNACLYETYCEGFSLLDFGGGGKPVRIVL